MGFSLDINDATTDAFGKTDYTKKNARLFNLTISPGWSANEGAERLADKVNAKADLKAAVVDNADGSATIQLRCR